jgi:hypothetical protein
MRAGRTIAVASGLTASALHIAKLQLVGTSLIFHILYFTTTTFVFMIYHTPWRFTSIGASNESIRCSSSGARMHNSHIRRLYRTKILLRPIFLCKGLVIRCGAI